MNTREVAKAHTALNEMKVDQDVKWLCITDKTRKKVRSPIRGIGEIPFQLEARGQFKDRKRSKETIPKHWGDIARKDKAGKTKHDASSSSPGFKERGRKLTVDESIERKFNNRWKNQRGAESTGGSSSTSRDGMSDDEFGFEPAKSSLASARARDSK